MPSSCRRPALRWLTRLSLVLLLVMAQHAAALHALSHDFERGQHGKSAQTVHACCIAFHGLDDAPTAIGLGSIRGSQHASPLALPASAPTASTEPSAYQSRAPPKNP